MGGVHNALTRAAWSKALQAALGVQKSDGGVERYGETLTPMVNLWGPPDWRVLRGALTFSRALEVTAGAVGTFAGAALLNRQGNRIFVVDSVTVFTPATSQYRVGTTTVATADTNFPSQLAGRPLDTRIIQDAPIRLGFGTPAGIVTSNHVVGVALANTLVVIPELEGVVITPGFALFVQTGADAANFTVNFKWHERAAFPGELFTV